MEKILIFGAGIACKRLIQNHPIDEAKAEIIGIIDNDPAKQGRKLEGYRIFMPAEGVKLGFDWILIIGAFIIDMRKQLIELGVQEKKIVTRYELPFHKYWFKSRSLKIFCKPIFINTRNLVNKKRTIVLFTHNFTYNGGTISLLRMAQVLQKHHFDIVVISSEEGLSISEFEKYDIPVIIDPNLIHQTLEDVGYIRECSMIIVNTLHYAPLLQKHDVNIPVVWWLHDPEETYQTSGYRLHKFNTKGLDIYAAGEIGWYSFAVTNPTVPKQILMYGIPEMGEYVGKECRRNSKLVFAMIGTFNRIKAQDILLDAIQMLPKNKLKCCVFWLIGNKETSVGKEILERSERMECVEVKGILNREQLRNAFKYISVLITPSRTDIMPIVNGEAMMNGIPCIVGENVGTATLLTNEVNGLIFKKTDALDLARKIEWMIDHRERIPSMGREARKVYEKYYSMEKFEQSVLELLARHGIEETASS